MEFVYPQFFWVMMVPFTIFVFLVITNRDKVSRIFSKEILRRLRVDSQTMPNYLRNIILFLAIFFMLLALARPVISKGERSIDLKGITAVVAIDISGSMRSRDIYPNRLVFAKTKVSEFLNGMVNDDIAVIAFAHSAFILSHFTSDKATLKQLIDGLNENYINLVSTNFELMAKVVSKLLKDKKQKILVVFSDGGDKEALKGFETLLKKEKITLYSVIVGTEQGAPVLKRDGETMKTKDGKIIITQRYDKLLEIAKRTGGDGLIAGYGDKDMRALVNRIHSDFNSKNKGRIKVKERVELFYYPLILATALLLIGFSSLPIDFDIDRYRFWLRWRRR
jgi:Ca-activated chloride channel family protein